MLCLKHRPSESKTSMTSLQPIWDFCFHRGLSLSLAGRYNRPHKVDFFEVIHPIVFMVTIQGQYATVEHNSITERNLNV